MHRELVSRFLAAAVAGGLWLGCGALGLGGATDEPVAARIGDEVVTVAELDESIREDLFKRETAGAKLYDVRSQALKGLVARRALEQVAAKRGLMTDALIEAEFAKLPPVTDAEVQAFHAQHTAELRGATLEQVGPRIRSHLENEAKRKAVDAIVASADVSIELKRPRVELRAGGPARGPDDARVTIVEFSDFQCPFCQRAMPVLEEIESRYPKDVRIVYRHLPLESIHPRSRASAEAAACAAEGNKFWEYHDRLFANAKALSDEDLRRYAAEVGLEPQSFDECVRTRRYADAVSADVQEAQTIGVTGTPAFVVNGIVLSGLQTAEALDAVIREELGLSAQGS